MRYYGEVDLNPLLYTGSIYFSKIFSLLQVRVEQIILCIIGIGTVHIRVADHIVEADTATLVHLDTVLDPDPDHAHHLPKVEEEVGGILGAGMSYVMFVNGIEFNFEINPCAPYLNYSKLMMSFLIAKYWRPPLINGHLVYQ